MVDFEKRCSSLEAELRGVTFAYDIINFEHSMMLEELGLSRETKPTIENIRIAIKSKCDAFVLNEEKEGKQ